MRRVAPSFKLLVVVFLAGASVAQEASSQDVVLRCNEATIESIKSTRSAPPIAARALAIVHTAVFDTWASFTDRARGVTWIGDVRVPNALRSPSNKSRAIAFACTQALLDLFPSQSATNLNRLRAWGFNPTDGSLMAMFGRERANAVVLSRHHDGSNQLGDISPGAYSDYSGYQSVNPPGQTIDPNRWQPLVDAAGNAQKFLVPHWGLVKPFSMEHGYDLRPVIVSMAPPRFPDGRFRKEALAVLHLSATLDDRSKMIAEYWADGPATETPPGTWNVIARSVANRDGLGTDETAQLFFVLNNALMDAAIVVWDCKRLFDSPRPATVIPFLVGDHPVRAWSNATWESTLIQGKEWRSYVATPPFAEFVSGHSTFSAAAAEVLRRFTGSDYYGGTYEFHPGSSVIEPGKTPRKAITLQWQTFTEAANEAGMSRRFGGIHFESGDLAGRYLGRLVASHVWYKAQMFVDAK